MTGKIHIPTNQSLPLWLQALGINVPNANGLAALLEGTLTNLPTPAPTTPGGGTGTDARLSVDGPKAIPTGVIWKDPMEIRYEMRGVDGRIRIPEGFYRSTNPGQDVFTLNCGDAPIDADNIVIAHAGRGISGGGGTNFTGRNISLYGLNPNVDNLPRERAIQISNGTNVDLQHISMQWAGGIYVELWSGNHTAGQSVKIRNIRSRNVIGGDGTGNAGHGGFRSVVQLKDIHTKGMELGFIESFNQSNKSRIEDQINLFRAGGFSADYPLLGNGFYLHGSYPFPADGSLYTGAALSLDGSSNAQYNETQSGWVQLRNAYAISNGNAAFNIAVGNDILYDTLFGITAGYLDDGSPMNCSYSGAWVGDFYGTGVSKTNFIKNIVMGFMRTKDVRQRHDVNLDATPGSILNVTRLPDPITKNTENDYFLKWRDFLNVNKQTCGSLFAGA